MTLKKYFLLFILLIVINATVYEITEINKNQRIGLVISENIKTLKTHYEILLHSQKISSLNLYERTIHTGNFLEIMSKANSADEETRRVLRKELAALLSKNYKLAQNQGVLQYHFVFPDNKVFLRMHKPDKFGDDLTNIREDFTYTNKTKKPIRGFTQGRTAHAFRNTFPLFDNKNRHIGAMEISFSSDGFQEYLTNISHIHTHFLVKKDIFDAKTWERDDLILKYETSAEHPDYMMTMNSDHTVEKCIIENKIKLVPVKEQIIKNEKLGKAFGIYAQHNGSHIDAISFIPVKNTHNEVVAWLVSYAENAFIGMTLKGSIIIKSVFFLVSLILIYFIYKEMKSKEKIQQEHNLLNDVLSATDDIIFVTDFQTIRFINKSFKKILNINHAYEYDKNVLDIFVVEDGFLHKELLKDDENFIKLIERTPESKRVVSILDKHFIAKSYKIDIVQIHYQNKENYLVTLTDITKMKEQELENEKKAYTDGLTGVFNRNKFNELIDSEIKNSKRTHVPLSIAILDIDKFKDFNDSYGHLIGDEILIMIAQYVKSYLRITDVFARWGGEEFVILFRGIDADKAKKVAEKIRENISQLKHPIAGHVTASFGVTELKDNDTLETMFERCDKALYTAKNNGRNRVDSL